MESASSFLAHATLTALCAAALVVLLAVALAKPFGYKVLVDHSDSMAPAIRTGDLLLTKVVPPRKAQVGDVVSFHSPGEGRLLTHRVIDRELRPSGRWAFVTRGDANTGVERWVVEAGGRVGRVTARLPKAGYAVGWLGHPIGRFGLVAGGGLALAVLLARRIWSL
ncbi:MAG TPA: signal peptidase I [Solirubrobacteraceae bacterium]|nr:signal peptidase I [Solirubrobacteraceae bacterium]